jgi:hypothetical protein
MLRQHTGWKEQFSLVETQNQSLRKNKKTKTDAFRPAS